MASCLRVSAGVFWQQGLSTGRADSLDRLSEARLSEKQCCAVSRAAKTFVVPPYAPCTGKQPAAAASHAQLDGNSVLTLCCLCAAF